MATKTRGRIHKNCGGERDRSGERDSSHSMNPSAFDQSQSGFLPDSWDGGNGVDVVFVGCLGEKTLLLSIPDVEIFYYSP